MKYVEKILSSIGDWILIVVSLVILLVYTKGVNLSNIVYALDLRPQPVITVGTWEPEYTLPAVDTMGLPRTAVKGTTPLKYSHYDPTLEDPKTGGVNCQVPCDVMSTGTKVVPELYDHSAACIQPWTDQRYVVVIPLYNLILMCNDKGGKIVHNGDSIWIDHLTKSPVVEYGTLIDEYYVVPQPPIPLPYIGWWQVRETQGLHENARDFTVGLGTPLVMPCDGSITGFGWDGVIGAHSTRIDGTLKDKARKGNSYVNGRCDDGLEFSILHLELADNLRVGRYVKGDFIGREDTYGNSTGPHVHMATMKDGKFIDMFAGL